MATAKHTAPRFDLSRDLSEADTNLDVNALIALRNGRRDLHEALTERISLNGLAILHGIIAARRAEIRKVQTA